LIFTEDNDHIDVLKKQNADVIVGGEELIEKVVNNELQFDRVISTPEMYKKITKPLARILGPRGIMPTEKKGTVTANVISALKMQSDAIVFKADSNAFISTVIGKVGLSSQQLVENIETFLQEIKSIKKGNKDKFIEKLVLKTKETPEILFRTDSNMHQ
jgi:large subunit ribosomal protein L1